MGDKEKSDLFIIDMHWNIPEIQKKRKKYKLYINKRKKGM
jgi:hypothetical protein